MEDKESAKNASEIESVQRIEPARVEQVGSTGSSWAIWSYSYCLSLFARLVPAISMIGALCVP